MVSVQVTVIKEAFALFSSAKTLEFTVVSDDEIPAIAVKEAFETIKLIMDQKSLQNSV